MSIFREYIMHQSDFPHEIITPNNENFDFILGFASETETGTGQFVPTWNDALTPEKVRKLKERYPKVRVVISIGGVGSEFNPNVSRETWITNAVSSIKAIIQRYNNQIDGIDIHYDAIRSNHEANFSGYIGEVINRLKKDPGLSIKVVSIAPIENEFNVDRHYRKLYADNSDNIDLVNYRFSNEKLLQFGSVREFINFYTDVLLAYAAVGKVIAGIRRNTRAIIVGGITYLVRNEAMPGIFFWDADELQNL